MKAIIRLIIVLIFLIPVAHAKDYKIDELELQEDLQRFYTRFTERLVSSLDVPKITKSYTLGQFSLRQYLLYDSESLKIVTSPFPEVNLMDMLVFIKLNKIVVRDVWIPKKYGALGKEFYQAFKDSEGDIEQIASKILSKEDLLGIEETIRSWRKQNPNQTRVEKIRIADFSRLAGDVNKQMQEEGRGFSLSNIIVDTRGAVQAVDQMVLVANRSIFLIQQLPFIIRLQLRIGSQEIVDDLGLKLSRNKGMKQLGPAMNKFNTAVGEMDALVTDSNQLVKNFHSIFPKGVNVNSGMKDLNSSLDKGIHLMNLLQSGQEHRGEAITSVKKDLRSFIWFIAIVVVITGACLSFVFWLGFYIVKIKMLRNSYSNIKA